MPEKKPNRRVQFTRSALREALIDLIAEKPLNAITVTDICARGDINRSTFYLHYKDVRDLLSELEQQIIDHIRSQTPHPILNSAVFADMLREIRSSPRGLTLMKTLLGPDGDPQFARDLQLITYEGFQMHWREFMPEAEQRYSRVVFSFIIPGFVATLAGWISGEIPDVSAEELLEKLRQLILHGVSAMTDQSIPL